MSRIIVIVRLIFRFKKFCVEVFNSTCLKPFVKIGEILPPVVQRV